jgi:hypothetical protein
MPNYRHKETGEIKRFASVRISWDENMKNKKEVCLITGENILENYDFVENEGEVYNVKMKKAARDGGGLR